MRKKHPKTREERITVNKIKGKAHNRTNSVKELEALETYISYSNLSDQVIAFMDYIGLLPDNAEVFSVTIGNLSEYSTESIPVRIDFTTRG